MSEHRTAGQEDCTEAVVVGVESKLTGRADHVQVDDRAVSGLPFSAGASAHQRL